MKQSRNRRFFPLCALLLALCVLAGCGAPRAAREPAYSGPTVSVGGQTVPVDESLEQSAFTPSDFARDEATGRVPA